MLLVEIFLLGAPLWRLAQRSPLPFFYPNIIPINDRSDLESQSSMHNDTQTSSTRSLPQVCASSRDGQTFFARRILAFSPELRRRRFHVPLRRCDFYDELQRMCSEMHVPGDFDVAQISWRPDYDPFFYRQLARRARRIYLFREEYIFDVEKAVVVETPQLGHATYVFAKPRSMDTFLALYTKITKDDIRRNRNNAAEGLGFLGRVIHGTNPRAWLKEVKQRIGEKIDFAVATGE